MFRFLVIVIGALALFGSLSALHQTHLATVQSPTDNSAKTTQIPIAQDYPITQGNVHDEAVRPSQPEAVETAETAEPAVRMATYDDDWLLDEAVCPADIHLTEWLEQGSIKNKTIYHMGTGGHHKLGMWNLNGQNHILGITASQKEFQHFIELAMKHPTLTRTYQVYFGDIYVLNPRLLPSLHIVALFHICEFRDDRQDAYGGLTDKQVVEIMLDALPADGRLLTYTGSFAYGTAQIILDELIAEGYVS